MVTQSDCDTLLFTFNVGEIFGVIDTRCKLNVMILVLIGATCAFMLWWSPGRLVRLEYQSKYINTFCFNDIYLRRTPLLLTFKAHRYKKLTVKTCVYINKIPQ